MKQQPENDNKERARNQLREAEKRGISPQSVVEDDTDHQVQDLIAVARREHPHTESADENVDEASASMPPRAKHAWLFVVIVAACGILLSWWGVSF